MGKIYLKLIVHPFQVCFLCCVAACNDISLEVDSSFQSIKTPFQTVQASSHMTFLITTQMSFSRVMMYGFCRDSLLILVVEMSSS